MSTLDSPQGIRVQRLARKLGVPWGYGTFGTYEPGVGHLVDTAEYLAHEIGHWLVAARWRRVLPYYGLGPPAVRVTIDVGVGLRVSPAHADWEEELASITGMAVLKQCGFLKSDVLLVMDLHRWFEDSGAHFPEVVADAVKRGAMSNGDANVLNSWWWKFKAELSNQ